MGEDKVFLSQEELHASLFFLGLNDPSNNQMVQFSMYSPSASYFPNAALIRKEHCPNLPGQAHFFNGVQRCCYSGPSVLLVVL